MVILPLESGRIKNRGLSPNPRSIASRREYLLSSAEKRNRKV